MVGISYVTHQFEYPGRLEAGQIAKEYSHLANLDITDPDNDELLWDCVKSVVATQVPSIITFLNQSPADIAWQILNTQDITCRFGDLYFALSILRKSITLAIDEDGDNAENDDDAQQKVERLGNACDQVLHHISIGFRENHMNLDYEIWRLETSRCITTAAIMIVDILKKLQEHEEDISKIFHDIERTLNALEVGLRTMVTNSATVN